MRPTAAEQELFGDLAEILTSGSGLRLLRTLEMLAAVPPCAAPPPSRAREVTVGPFGETAVPVPEAREAPPRRARRTGSRPATAHHLVLLGESAAAGYLLAPDLTPARALREVLNSHSSDPWEVTDLAAADLSATDILGAVRRAVELRPDVVVLYAGNNWPVRFRREPPPGHLGSVEQALAFRAAGMGGLRRLADEATRRLSLTTVSTVLTTIREAKALPVVVVPEVDLEGWSRSRPVPWLAGDGVARWHAAHALAREHLLGARPAEALASAETMLGLDGGHCATSHRLRATALRALGRLAESVQAARAEVDARAWDNTPTVPGATTVVQETLRAQAAEQGALVVDLPSLFESEPVGLPLFLDYCHLAPHGVAVTVSALAGALFSWARAPQGSDALRSTAERVCRLSPSATARVFLLAGLYTAHWCEGAGGEPDAARARLAVALGADPSLAPTVSDWVATRFAPRESTLFSQPMQKLGATLLEGLDPLWNIPGLDPDGLERLTALGGNALAAAVTRGLVGGPHDASCGPVDLLDPAYLWSSPQERASRRFFGEGSLAFRRLLWPAMDVALVADGREELTLDATLRQAEDPHLPPEPTRPVEVLINGQTAASLPLSPRWHRASARVPAASLVPGLNRLRLVFPPPRTGGDRALSRVGECLDLGIGSEIQPSFGEVFRLVARPSARRGSRP